MARMRNIILKILLWSLAVLGGTGFVAGSAQAETTGESSFEQNIQRQLERGQSIEQIAAETEKMMRKRRLAFFAAAIKRAPHLVLRIIDLALKEGLPPEELVGISVRMLPDQATAIIRHVLEKSPGRAERIVLAAKNAGVPSDRIIPIINEVILSDVAGEDEQDPQQQAEAEAQPAVLKISRTIPRPVIMVPPSNGGGDFGVSPN